MKIALKHRFYEDKTVENDEKQKKEEKLLKAY
jgi:hypothetical protein